MVYNSTVETCMPASQVAEVIANASIAAGSAPPGAANGTAAPLTALVTPVSVGVGGTPQQQAGQPAAETAPALGVEASQLQPVSPPQEGANPVIPAVVGAVGEHQ